MKFVNIRLLTGDFPAEMQFWRDVMGLHMTYGDEAMGYAYFETDTAGVELLTRDGFASVLGEAIPVPAPTGRQVALVFGVDDVDDAFADLVDRGAIPIAEPQDRPAWGVRSAHIADPEGYIIEIYTHLPGAETPPA